MMSQNENKLRVAIIGASGIGKNHAVWFQKNGAHVCAFLGSTSESITRTSEVIAQRLGYTPCGYTGLSQLLETEKPDAACIASPPELHYQHAQICIEHGVAVLCEKPLVYDAALASKVLIAQANELVANARAKNVLLGTQMQYSFIAEKLCELAGTRTEEIVSFSMEMETKNMKPGRSHETIWIEMAPHALSVLQKIADGSLLNEDSISCDIGALETTAKFRLQRADGRAIDAQIIARCNPNASTPLRRFSINGATIDYAGRKNAGGEFLTYLSTENQEIEMPDLVDILIGNFCAACQGQEQLKVTGEDGARNVAWLLQILERGQRI